MDTPFNSVTGQVEATSFPDMSGSAMAGMFAALRGWAAERRRISAVTHELGSYTDAELSDLGLRRTDIPSVARGRFARHG